MQAHLNFMYSCENKLRVGRYLSMNMRCEERSSFPATLYRETPSGAPIEVPASGIVEHWSANAKSHQQAILSFNYNAKERP